MFRYIFRFVMPFFFLMLIAFSQNSFGQLSGSYTIPSAPFATVKSAFDSLNQVGVGTGGVTFNVTTGYTESVSDSVFILTATGTASNPIVFQKSGVGANPLITRTDAGTKATSTFGGQGDAVIIIQGSDYVTFDGIDVAASDQGIEYGYYLRKVDGTNGCKYVTIKNAVIDMTKGTSAYVVGIYSSNNNPGSLVSSATGIAVTSTDGRNEYVTITGNTIQDVHAGIILRSYNHTTAPNDFQDFNFVVGTSGQGNIIQNYAAGSATTSYGVYLINHTNPTVSYNTINNVGGGGANSTAQIYGIFMSQTATNPGGTVVMNNNNITLGQANTASVTGIAISPACVSMTVNDNTFSIGTFASTTASFLINITGAATTKILNGNQNVGAITKTGVGAFTCLASSGSPVNGTETFTGNRFTNITVPTTSAFTGITVSSSGTSTRYFYNNKVSDITMGSGTFSGMSLGTILTEEVYNDTVMTATGTGSATGISCSSGQAGLLETVRDNYVTGLNFAGGSGSFTGIATGGPSSTSTRYVYNNTVTNCSGGTGFQSHGINSGNITNQEIYNNTVSGITTGGNLNGLTFVSQSNGTSTVYNNTVYDLTTSGDRAAIGISNGSSGITYFYKNSVSKLSATNVGTITTVRGIDVTTGYKNYVYNNLVSDLNAPSTTATGNVVFGINSTQNSPANTIYLYNNTIYVNSNGTTAYKSYGIFSNSGHNTELRNNLVVNISAGLAFAYGRSTNALGTYSMSSDNNNFYSSYKTYIGGTTDTLSTISQFKTTFYPREQSSFAESSPFVNVSTAPFDVHINPAIASQTESGGTPVTTPIAITNDYDGDVRNATNPDVGADEFTGITTDLTGPVISYSPLGFTGSLTDRTLVVNISDRSGVPSTSPGWPMLYWKKNYNGAWTADTVDTVVGNDYTFTFGGGVAQNDTVYYYVAAQDGATTPNVRIVPTPGSGGYTSNPPAAATPPTNPDWYKISDVSLAGDYTVGVAEFNRITGRTISFVKSGDKLIPMENGKTYTGDLYVKKAEHPEYNYPDNVQGVYTTLNSAVNDLNLRGVTAPVNFLLTDALYDGSTNTFPLIIKVINENLPTAVNQVTFKPNTGVASKITHSLATNTIFKILSKYINIDGSNSGGTGRDLTIENSSTTSPRVIWFGSVGTNPISWCTVKNCNIIIPVAATDGYGVSIADSSTTPTAGYSNNLTVQNNYITGPYGVYVFSPVVNNLIVPGNGSGLSINGNTIDSSYNGGMFLNGLDNISVINNTVSNIRGTTGGGGIFIFANFVLNSSISNNIIGPNSWVGGTVTGIRVGNNFVTNSNLLISGNTISGLINPGPGSVTGISLESQTGGVEITKNKISNLKQTNTTSRTTIGINLNGGIPNGSITVANNFIWDIASYGDVSTSSNNAYGIGIQSFTAGANGYKIYHNTVALTTDQTLTTSNPACLLIGSGISTPGAVDIRNNIFANFMTVGANRYAVINGLSTNVNLGNINFNDYYTTGPNLGRQGSTNYADITAWRTATGQDVNSISADPKLVSASDLHIDPSSLIVSNNGTYIAAVTDDIDGDVRNNPPDIGADEYTFTGPVSGTFTIPSVQFANIQSAINFINQYGVGTGGVTFNVTAGHTESTTDSLVLTATGTSTNPIIFQKSGTGANPIVTRTDAGTKTTSVLGGQGDGVLTIQGSDYVTFDGIDVAASLSSIEYGYFLRKVDGTDGCKNITIKNSVVDLTKGTSAFVIGIYSSNLIADSPVNSANGVTVTNVSGRNENITLTGNTVQDVHLAIFSRGFNHTTPFDFYDQNVVIGMSGAGNTLQNFGGGSATASYGVFANYTNNLDVSYNTINNTANGGTAFTHQGFAINHTTSNASNGTYNNNNINLSSNSTQMMRAIFAGTTGISTMDANNNVITLSQAGTGEATGIQLQSSQTGSTTNLNNNTISYGTFASTSNSNMFANFSSANTVTMNNNQNSGTVNKTGASGNLTGLIYQGFPTNGNIIITGNTFDSITVAGTAQLTGINASGSNTNTQQIDNNTVTYLTGVNGTMNGITLSTASNSMVYNNIVNNLITSGTGSVTGLGWGGNNATVYNNNVNTITGGGTNIVAMLNGSSQTTSCYKNSVYNITSTSTGATASLSGIQVSAGTVGNNVYNNYISDLKVPNTTSVVNALYGINCSASGSTTKIGVYHNTIYLNSTGASAYRSFGIFSNSGHQADIRNNIVVNTSTGNPVGYGRSTTNLATYSPLSDGNNFFATNIHWDGTTFYTTLDSYKNLVFPKDQSTFSENSPFVNSATAPYDLHINTGVATQTESGGRPVTTPVAVTDDFDGNTRNANFPDVGADEFSGIASDLTAPIIAYTPLLNTGSLTDRTLVVSVTDPSGVPAGTDTLGWPRVYWKKNYNGTYAAVIPTSIASGNYTFNFGNGVAPGDTVFYYLVAQDGVTPTPNVRAFPTPGAGGYTFNPPAAGTPPTSPSSYFVTNSSLSGDYTVGATLFREVTGREITFEKTGNNWIPMENGQRYYGDLFVKKVDYPELSYPDGIDGIYLTLTAAVNDLSLRGVSGPVNFLLTDAAYTTGETFPLVVNITNEFKPTSVNKVTIKPNTGVTSLIQGSSPVMFRIFSNYINIDGSNSGGTDRSLTIQNDRTIFPRVVSFASIGTTPVTGGSIKNTNIINGTNDISNSSPAVLIADSTINPTGPTTVPGYFTNIVVQNNRIQKTGIGINAVGVPGSGNGNGLMIHNNSLNDSLTNSIGWQGIVVTGADGATVTNNNIGNMITGNTPGPQGIVIAPGTINSTISNNIIGPMTITAFSGPIGMVINTGNANSNLIISNNTITGFNYNQPAVIQGIDIGGLTGGILISKNRIYNLKQTYVHATTAFGAYGIRLNSSLTAANITLANNFIWDISAYGRASSDNNNSYGIYVNGGGGYNIYHNTISLTTDQTLTTGLPACINISSSITTANSLDIRNNIFTNFQTVGTERYAIISKAPATVFSFIDNNDYYTTGPNLGFFGTANVLDLAAWKTATGKDVNSISADPMYVDVNDLHINTSSSVVDGKGFYLSIVPEDIDGDTRNNPSDIGADEYDVVSPIVNYFRSKASGNWNVTSTWETSSDNLNWADATVTPNDSSNVITVLSGDTITVTQSVDVDQTTIEQGGVVIVNGTPIVFTISNGPDSLDMIVNGYLKATGTPNGTAPHSVNAEGTLQFGSTGVYEHNQNSGGMPVSIWTAGSTAIITGTTGNAPANRNQNYYNLTLNTPGNTATGLNFGFDNTVIGGDINVVNTGTGRWQLTAPSTAGDSLTVTINGNIIQTGGNFSATGSGTLSYIEITVNGDINVTGGNFSVSRGSQGGGSTKWYLSGENFSMSNATTQNSNSAGAKFVFSGTTQQNLTLSNVTFSGGFPVEVAVNAILNAGESEIKGSGIFTLNDGATLQNANEGGLDSLLQNTGTKTLSSIANYIYNGTVAQITGNLLPASVNTLTTDNTSGVTLSHHGVSTGTLNLVKGKLSTSSANLLTVSGSLTSSVVGGNDTTYVNGPLALTLPASLIAGTTYNFPIGKGSYNPLALIDPITNAEGLLIVQSEVFDENSGGTPGSGLSTLNTNRYWSSVIISGDTNLVSTKVQLTEVGLTDTMGIGKSATQTGAYELISSITPSGGTITSDAIISLGYFAIGEIASTTTFQLSVNVTNGWNMVSIPGLHPVNQNINTWWQYRDLGADVFKYLGGYQSVTTTVPGIGYWMKHSGARTYNTGDEWPAGGIQIVPHNPITGASGWNMFGGYELSVGTAGITTVPGGLQSGSVYKYSGGYQIATMLDPGYGYWIKLTGAGQIIIPETMAKGKEPVEMFPENWGKIILTDAAGVSYTLYAVNGNVNLDQYELPPAPMAGMYDFRFSSGRIAEDINNSVKTIDMSGVVYPLTVRVENVDIRLMDETGKSLNVNLRKGEDVVINDATIQKLMVSGELIPAEYALEQNYPNPFNPSTVIEFSLPENVGNVKLSIYNALGEKVAELVNTALVAGKYSYTWNAQNVATGMYIYELRTDNFVSVKKMLLLK